MWKCTSIMKCTSFPLSIKREPKHILQPCQTINYYMPPLFTHLLPACNYSHPVGGLPLRQSVTSASVSRVRGKLFSLVINRPRPQNQPKYREVQLDFTPERELHSVPVIWSSDIWSYWLYFCYLVFGKRFPLYEI